MPRASSARHSRDASHRHRPCPTIWSSSSPLLAKESRGFQRGGASRCVVKCARCFSRQPRIVALSTPTSFVGSRGPPSHVYRLCRLLAFISEKSSTRKSSTSRNRSSLKQPSTTCSFGATSGSRAQRTCKSYGQINHLPRSTQTHRAPLAGARCWSHPTRQRDQVQDGGCHKKRWK